MSINKLECYFCNVAADTIEGTIEEGWVPYFYDGDEEKNSPCCSECASKYLQQAEDGEMELKPESEIIMTKIKVYVCDNHETLASGYIADATYYCDSINNATEQACKAIDDCGLNLISQCNGIFRDWHGGKFDQFAQFKGQFVRTMEPVSEEITTKLNEIDNQLIESLAKIGQQEEADKAELAAELAAEEAESQED